MTLASAGGVMAVTAYFCLTLLFFWVSKIPNANRSTLWWGAATTCTLLARGSLLVLPGVVERETIETLYGVLITIEKWFLVHGFLIFFSVSLTPKQKNLLNATFAVELCAIAITLIAFDLNTVFAIQFSLFNAFILTSVAAIIYRHRHTYSAFWLNTLTIILIVFGFHWLTFPVARTVPMWLEYGLIFGNLMNVVIYLSFAVLALVAFQHRLIEAEQTAQINAKKAIKSNKAKSEFLANMSHEIRTPINGIIGMLELLKKSDLTVKQKQQVTVAASSGRSLLTLINDILDFSKIEAGKLRLDEHPFNLKEAIEDVGRFMRELANDKDLTLYVNTAELHTSWVFGDDTRLRQILINLAGNATKFTHSGCVTIKAKASQRNDQVTLECSVIDTGIGIEQDKLHGLFDAFSQADNSTTREYGGTGLGLTICKRLCALMGGDIMVTSTPGQGSTFSFTVVFKATQKQTAPSSPTSIATEKPHPTEGTDATLTPLNQTMRILLVEDNETNQFVVESFLEDMGLTCEVANNGSEALEKMLADNSSRPFSIVLMDCQMPVMDGYECTQKIRLGEAGDQYRSVPIIAMTANAMQGDKELCLDSGMNDYLSKPLDEQRFVNMLLRWGSK